MPGNLISEIENRDVNADLASIERRLDEFRDLQPTTQSAEIAAARRISFDTSAGIPAIPASELNAEILQAAISTHGSLVVRGLLPDTILEALRTAIDEVLNAIVAAESQQGVDTGAQTFHNPPGLSEFGSPREIGMGRAFLASSGGAWCIESPGVAETLLELYESLSMRAILSSYLQEKPCVSALKWVLRRTEFPTSELGWHQDGAFMGTHIKSLNMWLSLSHCGGNSGAPGLDIVPHRLDKIIPPDGTNFDWISDPSLVQKALGDSSIASPEFAAGDAWFSDHLTLHRTQFRKHFSRKRYAIETWFFGDKSFPKNQIPLAW